MAEARRGPFRPAARLAAVLLLLAAPAAAACSRVVAVGDVHGAYDGLRRILRAAGLTDDADRWSGGGACLVQTGDLTDRGAQVREVMDLLRRLEGQAPEAGGELHVLLGNHEVMNLIGDLQDVVSNPEILARFTDERSAERRDAAWNEWRQWRDRQQRLRGELSPEQQAQLDRPLRDFLGQSREQWMASHPLGLVEYREAFAADGEYGGWLRELPAAVRLADTLFLHAGISPAHQDWSVERLNELHAEEIEAFDRNRRRIEARDLALPWFSWVELRLALKYQILVPSGRRDRALAVEVWKRLDEMVERIGDADSPLWYRGYSLPPAGLDDEALAELLSATASEHGVRRVVAAHSPLRGKSILPRLGGRLFLIDTGMLSSYYGGRPSALEIDGGRVRAIYPDEQRVLAPADGKVATAGAAGGSGSDR